MIILVLLLGVVVTQNPLDQKYVGEWKEGTWQTNEKYLHIFRIPTHEMIFLNGDKYTSFFRQNSTMRSHKKQKEQGEAECMLYSESQQQGEGKQFANYLFVRLYYPKYKNGRVIELNIPLKQVLNKSSNSWKVKDIYLAANLLEDFQLVGKMDIELSVEIYQDKYGIEVQLISESLNVKATFNNPGHGYGYFVWFTLINLIQLSFIFCYFQMRDRNILYNTSEWLLVQGCCFLLMQALLYLLIAFTYFFTPLKFLILNTVLNMVVMMLLLRKFQAVLEKFKNTYNLLLGLVFIGAYCYLVGQYYETKGFWVFQSMIYLWQIYHSMVHGGVGGASLDLLLIILISRFPLWHLLLSDDNIFRLEPSASTFLLIFVNTVLHLSIIGVQRKYGGRFLIPQQLIPGYHDYFKAEAYDGEIAKSECSICLNEIRKKPEDISQELTETQEEFKNVKIWYAIGPCKHAFHPKCLRDWMNERLVCPNCRKELPPMNAEK